MRQTFPVVTVTLFLATVSGHQPAPRPSVNVASARLDDAEPRGL